MASVDFFGEPIRLVDEPSEWAMAEFAASASADANELAGLAAVMVLLEDCVDPQDWPRFKQIARKNRAKVERDLMPIVVRVFQGATDRPTQQPSGSSDGLPTTAPSSTGNSSSPAMLRLAGRPDLQQQVDLAQQAQAVRRVG